MKEKILKVLTEAGQDFVSGQRLCELLGVTRQAVWKNIGQLKEHGYQIESVSNKGYRLVKRPDVLYGPEIASRLPEQGMCRKVDCHESIDSTNLRAKQLAELGEPEGTLVVADCQTAGRGRRGRNWVSESGTGIWMSFILRPELNPSEVPGVTLLTALAVNRAIREVCQVESQIKWPNDIVLDGKKVCGILTEMSSEVNYVHYAVAGIGINANMEYFPEEIADTATSVYLQTGKKADRVALIGKVVEEFSVYYREYQKVGNLSPFLDEYNQMLVNRDRQVQIFHGMTENANPAEIEVGIARGIDENGVLLVEVDGKQKRVMSGEVSVRGIYGYV